MQNEQCKREYMESVKSVAVDEVLDILHTEISKA